MQFSASLRSQHPSVHVQKVLKEVEQACVSHSAQKEPSYLVLLACDVRVLDLHAGSSLFQVLKFSTMMFLDNAPSNVLNGLLLISVVPFFLTVLFTFAIISKKGSGF